MLRRTLDVPGFQRPDTSHGGLSALFALAGHRDNHQGGVMADEQFKPGDVVQLKSGGPWMTVKSVSANGHTEVQWFNESSGTFDLRSVILPQHSLETVKKRTD